MHRLRALIVALALVCAIPPAAQAGVHAQLADGAPPTVPLSQVIQQAGYPLSDAEAAYLDAEQQVQVQWATPLFQALTLAGPEGLPDSSMQAVIVAELQKLVALDPNAGPEAPASLQRLRELIVPHRAAVQRAASLWVEGLQAGDPDWRQRGAEEFTAAGQSMMAWQQEFATRYPPPAQPQP